MPLHENAIHTPVSGSAGGGAPAGLADFTGYEKMAGEYRVMGIYPRGHLMEFVRPTLNRRGTAAAGSSTPVEGGPQVALARW